MEDGTFVPMEITKTVIERDGSRSITRSVPRLAPHNYQNSNLDISLKNMASRNNEVYGNQRAVEP